MDEAMALLSTEECSGKRVQALWRCSGGHGHMGDNLPTDSHTRSVGWPAPLCASTLKEYVSKRAIWVIAYFFKFLITHAFLDVIVIWRSGWSPLLPHVPGHSAC